MRDIRLGDDIDDFCVRCKRVMNHAVVSVISAAPAKVRCRTCHSDHDYRHEQAPPPKVDARKAALFQRGAQESQPRRPPSPDVDEVPDSRSGGRGRSRGRSDVEAASGVEVAEVAVAEEPAPVEEAEPKAKAKAKGKGKK